MSRSRQLAAIMFTDIQGYTALMQQDEEKGIRARDKHRQVFNALMEKFGGRVLQYYGDGTLSIFHSALEAVQCGIEMQLDFQTPPAIPVRIGIHTGDIVFSEEEIIGDSVNVASRIESLAVPGSVFISGKVYDEIKNQQSIQATLLNTFQLKNVQKPIEVYAIANTGLIVPEAEAIIGKTEEEGTIPSKPAQEIASKVLVPTAILATKLYVPPPRPNRVQRPQLNQRLSDGLYGKLTLVSAPAGFGKSTLVSGWLATIERPVTWLSLDKGDQDPTRFLTYFIAALQKIAPNLGGRILSLLESTPSPPFESLTTLLLNELMEIREPFVCILDDYQLLDAPVIDQTLSTLLDYLPPQMHLIIVTREDPNLPLARLRARGELSELRAADLRFTADEAAAFFQQVMGLNLKPNEIQALETRTEGWIAGLQLAALSMQGRTDLSAFIKAFAGDNRYIVDYLLEEVLLRQSEELRSFLLQTSILERLCGSLCDALTGRDDGKTLLEILERGNLFVIPLDDKRLWFRYHHLFADVLYVHLKEEQTEVVAGLHQKASKWYEQNNFPADAIRHALAGRDFERAAGLIELAHPVMDAHFQLTAWLKWVETLPEEIVRRMPVLSVGYAWALFGRGDMEAGATRLKDAEQCLGAAPEGGTSKMLVVDEEQFQALPASIASAYAYLAQTLGDLPATIHHARQALELMPEGDEVRHGVAASLLGLAYWANGELDAAYHSLIEGMERFQHSGNTVFAISSAYGLADIRMTQGRLQEALRIYEQTISLGQKTGEPALPGTADLYLGLSTLNRELGQPEIARQNLLKSEELGEQAALPDWRYRLCLAQARFKEDEELLGEALDLLNEAERLYYRSPLPIVRPLTALKTRVWLKQGELNKALTWVRMQQLSPEDELSFLKEFEHLTLVRVLLLQYEREGEAQTLKTMMHLLERLKTAAREGGRVGSLTEILILCALGHQLSGHRTLASADLEQALRLARPEGYIRIFIDEGQPLHILLKELHANGCMPDYISKLLALSGSETTASDQLSASSTPPLATPLIEPLSQRESEILQLISEGRSNREISERLFLALSTVKGHNQHIFEKLGVRRRTEAVARARELGLL